MRTIAIHRSRLQDPPTADRNLNANATSDAHNALARELAEQSIVLLKNDGWLDAMRALLFWIRLRGWHDRHALRQVLLGS